MARKVECCMRFSLQLFLEFLLIESCRSVTCPNGYSVSGNICYNYHRDCITWDAAVAACTGGGGFLFKIADDVSFQLVNSLVAEPGLCDKGVWVGARFEPGDIFKWRDGSLLSRTNQYWAEKQPDEGCVEVRNDFGNLMNDRQCSTGKGYICQVCHNMDHCISVKCPTPSRTTCEICEENGVFYKPSSNNASCERLCSWNNHTCWPGSCTDGLTRGCKCAPGFRKVTELGSGATYSGETSCQPDTLPDILTCDTVAVGPNGEKTRAESASNSTECKHLQDMYGNFQPVQMQFKMMSEFTVDISSYTTNRPSFISEEKFGISDTTVNVVKRTLQGHSTVVSDHKQFVDSNASSSNVKQTLYDASNITVRGSKYSLDNGEALCLEFEAKGGGYLKGIDRRYNNISGPIPYQKVIKQQTVCYRYDNCSPKHCAELGMCASEPLDLQDRITRSNTAKLTFSGWTDPIPKGGTNITASSIESYEIRVNEVPPGNGTLKVDLKSVLTAKVNSSINMMDIALPSESPRLYCITLEVKDVADNVMQARRFMLFDNNSFIETNKNNHFRFASASQENNFTWQTHHNDICIIWEGYFINKMYLQNELLNPIEPAPHQAIRGVYEQVTGLLPVQGTANVYGIIKYFASWNVNDGNFTSEQIVQDFQNQTFCTKLNISDGQTYTFKIRPVDIVGNTFNESRTLHIDRSRPHINNVWLEKDGYEMLFVHNTTDLSKMQMAFDALDPHSGLKLIEWKFGIADTSTELLRGYISVGRTGNRTSADKNDCYCPDIGNCEHFRYKILLNKLIEASKNVGNHNRNYVFTITVTNNAMLSTTELIDVLVDSSPPQKGVVFEGPIDYNDIDYTSEDSFVVHWHGFIDHESGVKLYRLGLANRCLTKEELSNMSGVFEYNELPYTETSVRMSANFTGKRYISIIALNNAMESSDAVCSDGITRDISAPSIQDLTLQHASWSESVICHNGRPYVLLSNLQKKSLYNCSACSHVCNGLSEQATPGFLQTTVNGNEDGNISDFLCQHLPLYTNETLIYLPDDHIYLQWNVAETGSQIEDFFVGFGKDRTEKDSPSVFNYVSTDRKLYFKRKHDAIGSDEIFYIFIKVLNKAGMSSIATLGPILIDQTPPMYRYVQHVNIEENSVVLAWESDTFYDDEQTEPINKIIFQFVTGVMPVSPLLEWRLDSSDPCPSHSGGCIKYPISRLQSHETGDGDLFGMIIHIYNNAGHFTSVSTETFQVPSRYPPGQGMVFDLDSEQLDVISKDINVHFTGHIMCAFWTGFKHHAAIALEVGVGTERVLANVVPFQSVFNTSVFCLNSSSISAGRIQYFLIRANCSGGSTISASNGVLIKPIDNIQEELHIHLGKDCHSTTHFEETTNFANFTATVVLHNPFYIGQRYLLFLEKDNWKQVTIDTADGIVEKSGDMNYFTPFVEHQRLHLKHSLIPNTTMLMKFYRCPSENLISSSTQLTINWKTETNNDMSGLLYSVALFEMIDSNEYIIVPFQTPIDSRNITLRDLHLEEQKQYIARIKICNNIRCLQPTQSLSFAVETSEPKISFLESEINILPGETCVSINVSWKAPDECNIIFYQWTLSSYGEARKLLLMWENVIPSNSSIEKVQKCVDLPVHGHATLFVCVRLFSVSGLSSTTCERTTRPMMWAYKADVVYELDTSKDKMILQKISSIDIGYHYTQLHDSELDVGTANSSVAGALVYASERTVNWFLMTSRYVPDNCNTDVNCHAYYTTNTGYVEIKNEDMTLNELYYICAFSNYTEVKRESSVETLNELSSCGNGFILDSLPPTSGQLFVHHQDGFISNPQHIFVSWTGFDDNVDASLLAYPGKIQYYSIGIGTHRGGYNLAHEFKPGDENRVILHTQTIKDGTPIFVTVNATDYAGYSSGADSSEFIVDTSPPFGGRIILLNNLQRNQYINDKIAHFKFEAFSDPHSGIDYFNVGLGTFENMIDIKSETRKHDDFVEWNMSQLIDGHPYYITAQAVNRAGLLSKPVSLRFIVDRTPPIGGHVLDGIANEKDIDFQADIEVLHSNWRNFYDTESEIALYRVGLGTEPYQFDQKPLINVGQLTEFTLKGPFIPGLKYFVTVEACNRADLCTIRSSDGVIVDNSPPIRGIVYVGPGNGHNKYLAQRSSVQIKWVGFEDPQSSIDHFEVCVSTTGGVCDVVERFNALLHSNIIKSNITLPTNHPLTATVWATNGVGMRVSQVSDTFIVDDIPPVVKQAPQFRNIKTVRSQHVQWDKSMIKLQWEFGDDISPIVRHEISLKTHHEGHTPVEHVVLGSERTVYISLDGNNWLHSGDTYNAIVTACNAAGLCTSESTHDLLIDSTPPHVGGFKQPLIWTEYEHANGQRYTNLALTWYGFHDTESKVEKYFITVSRKYSNNELSNGVVTVLASNDTKLDMQLTLELSEVLVTGESIILSIWAQNVVGLNSSIARVTVDVLSSTQNVMNKSGTLEIQKHSCDIHFCNKDCTCAVLGRPCVEVTTNVTCSNMSYSDAKTQNLPTFTVSVGLMDENITMSSSSACISGHWFRNDDGKISEHVHRFEWSIGIFGQAIGEGVFNLKVESPWTDIGMRTEFIYCLPANRSFIHDDQYVIYVKAWYDKDTYLVFQSTPILFDFTPPIVRRGKYIRDGSCTQDLDFVSWTDHIDACWDGVFSEQQTRIQHYEVSVGSRPHNDDIYPLTNVGLDTGLHLQNISLSPGSRYYVTVIAMNTVGLQNAAVSDGFIVDTDLPIAGVVFNTLHHINAAFQKSNASIGISWHGFQDNMSGIKRYFVAFSNAGSFNETNVQYTDTHLLTSYVFSNLSLQQGESYIGVVKSEDAAGHQSSIVISDPFTVDVTPPTGYSCHSTERLPIYVTLTSKELSFNATLTENTVYYIRGNITNASNDLYPVLIIDKNRTPIPFAERHDGLFMYNYCFLAPSTSPKYIAVEFGTFLTEIQNATLELLECKSLQRNDLAAVTVKQIGPFSLAVNLMVLDYESDIRKIKIGAGTSKGGFQIKSLFEIHNQNNNGIIRAPFKHGTLVYITAIAENHAGLSSVFHSEQAITIDHTPPNIGDIKVTVNVSIGFSKTVTLQANWKVNDNETAVEYCRCLLGHSPSVASIQPETESDTITKCQFEEFDLPHASTVYVTVKCVNSVELPSVAFSGPVTIYLEPPGNSQAFVSLIPVSEQSAPTSETVHTNLIAQSNKSALQFEWNDFVDDKQILSYQYRVLNDGQVILEWSNAIFKDMASVNNLGLVSGEVYTAEVKATNAGNLTSTSVKSYLMVLSEPPKVSGLPMKVSAANRTLHFDWTDVFLPMGSFPHHFSLVIGSRDGFPDIADVQFTRDQVYDVIVPESTHVTNGVNELFISVSCVYNTGLFSTYQMSYKL